MPAAPTIRLGIYVWSSDGDEFNRDQMNTSHEALEDRVAQFFVGSSELPTQSQYARSFLLNTSNNVIYYNNTGISGWQAINATDTAVSINPGSTNGAGSATTLARSDHTHALPNWGSAPPSVTTSSAAGSATTFSRSDHTHNLADNVVVESKIANNAVTVNKIATGAVQETKIADGAVTKSKIAANQQLPTGTVTAFAGAVAPTGWVLCDGTLYSQTNPLYADLFAVISTTYGSGSGTFAVPDLRNRVARGVGTTPLAGTGGADTVTLTTANMPTHSHTLTNLSTNTEPTHVHGTGTYVAAAGGAHTHEFQFIHDHGFPPGWDHVYRNTLSNAFLKVTGPEGSTIFDLEFGLAAWQSGGNNPRTTLQADYTGSPTGNTHAHSITGSSGQAGSHSHTLSGTTGTAGSGTPVNVTPSHVGLNYIIKL